MSRRGHRGVLASARLSTCALAVGLGCATRGEPPEKPLSGKFLLRLEPRLHRAVAMAAEREGKSLNAWVKERLQDALDD